ncbi:MAG: nicotinate-nucleotide adenylyltransferase [Albidovulum sp.]|nr:nicotinate-nucleotide adenylyltransferase [Albidovulum sp.]
MNLRFELPHAIPGQRIGILGGSFNPPHSGHVLATLWSLKCFGLDRIWWLVSPGNPLKTERPSSMRLRIEAASRMIRHPRVVVSNFEEVAGTNYTYRTVAELTKKYPSTKFVWLMGADSLLQLHHWKNWNEIVRQVPIGVIARPGNNTPARFSAAAARYKRFKIPQELSRALPYREPPAWTLINLPMDPISSTSIRREGRWNS